MQAGSSFRGLARRVLDPTRNFIRLDRAQKRRALEAVSELCRAGIQLKRKPSDRSVELLGGARSPADVEPIEDFPAQDQLVEAAWVGRAVRDVAARLPWHPVCLPQALAARRMCERRNIPVRLVLGARMEDGFEAHAWIEVGRTVPVGGRRQAFVPLAVFSSNDPAVRGSDTAAETVRRLVDELA
jgi:hypothetical protein